ncbi:hypothetical protein acsn021_09150 [Anaerocolumna cellulosilytica]|uniref:Uncharacterized protein n=1 Tax=Anaerocolumna cellulosilytica TaxID=433286 RepID=A0A6S6QUI5_9FIRM|nr:hypothetical protein [Anaerocolumna cellulosilytica]MBB5194402.1 hypothetical protein [Anaerocolumna cellulosilytica]BCJ93346.1 hypothetical protein acsn021_09150 [Anaerocolumna cellulosilytica]
MFITSFAVNPSGQSLNGTLYSKLETGVIVAIAPNGNMKPLYFEYKDLSGNDNYIKINEVFDPKEDYYAGLPMIVYSCTAFISNKCQPCLLRYHILEHFWELMY